MGRKGDGGWQSWSKSTCFVAYLTILMVLTACGTQNQGENGGSGGSGGDAGYGGESVAEFANSDDSLAVEAPIPERIGAQASFVIAPSSAVACTLGSQCPTGNCVDGFCCDSKCDNKCMACSAAKKGSGVDGICGSIAYDTDPDNDCPYGACDGKNQCKNYNGYTCGSPAQCLSNYCVDGYCCGNICMGACQACSAAKKGSGSNGVCGNIAATTDPDNECNPGECTGAGACNASPQPLAANGAACSSAAQCSSGFCADGVCCNSWCLGTCQACTAARKGSGTDGTCGNIANDKDPDDECWGGACNGAGVCKQYNGVPCIDKSQCLSGYCVDGFCCGNICTGMCYACSEARKGQGYDGVCGPIASGKDPDNECNPGECAGAGTCNQPQTPQANGTTCASAGQCASGNCIDGVCCDTACTGLCSACTTAKKGQGTNGTCGPIIAETDPDNECGVGGRCGGNATCKYYNSATCTTGTQCFSNYCVDGVCCGNVCTGTCYACSAAKKGQGADGSCGLIANTRDADNECNPGECNGSGACNQLQMQLANGAACSLASQCSSGFCSDGVCCDKACSGLCEACSATKKGNGLDGTCSSIKYDTDPDNECAAGSCSGSGTCQFFNGVACNGTSECLSNYCVDGYCCGNVCNLPCMACSAAKKGSGSNGVCGNIVTNTDPDNECALTCNGSGACNFAANGAICTTNAECASGFCADGVCCNSACSSTCMACNIAGSVGTCANVPAGQNDPNGVPPCNDMCDGSGMCPGAVGAACTSGVQCTSRVCENQVCAAVNPPGPLAWSTILKHATGPYGYKMVLEQISPPANGGISGGGLKYGHVTLGPYALNVCCWNAAWSFNFDGAGYPTNISDAWMDTQNTKYTKQYARIRYANALASYWTWYSGPAYSSSTTVSTSLWSRSFYRTTTSLKAGDGGHVLIGASIALDDQNKLNPVDFGDGIPVTNSRLVKYAPDGSVQFNVPSGALNVGPILGPLGDFYDITRSASEISIVKQNGLGQPAWTKTYAAPVAAGVTPKWAHAFDTAGNFYLAFNFNGTANLGNGALVATGIHDLGLAKLDVNGTAVWSKRFGTASFDLQSVELDPTGTADIVLRASFAGTADFGNGAFTTSPVMAKFDATGTLVWRAPSPMGTFSVRGSESGAAYVVSTSNDVDMGWGPPLTGAGVVGIVVAKYGPCADSASCRPSGLACTTNTQCESGFCVDGVCCDKACTGACQACTAAKKGSGANGTCGPIAVNTDPDNECPYSCSGVGTCAQVNGLSCSTSSQCLSGYCVDGYCCSSSCSDPCVACSLAKKGSGSNGTCGPIAVGTDPDSECGSGKCSGTTGCSMGSLGSICTANNQCASGFCAEGICCNASCTGLCQSCRSAKKGSGSDGICGNIVDGTDPDNECSAATCNGAGACELGNLGRPCVGTDDCYYSVCVEGVCCDTQCTGTCKSCLAAKKGSGTNGTCGNVGTGLDPDNECVNGACGSGGTCKSDNGLPCSTAVTCVSGHCVDGVCCASACNGTCQACSAATKGSGPDGVCGYASAGTDPHNTCALECDGAGACLAGPNGSTCLDGGQCTSGFCVDGYCCDSACSGTCQACSNVKKGSGSNGQCGFVIAGKDTENECLGTCNGSGACAAPNLLADGSACTGGAQCNSGFCADGVCCNTSCYETCKACNVPGSIGVCSPYAPGACNVCSGILAIPTIPATPPKYGSLARGDFDNDGLEDVAHYSAGVVTVQGSLGNGVFTTLSQTTIGTSYGRIVAGDLNADGALDLVAGQGNTSVVTVLMNQGDGSFAPGVDYAAPLGNAGSAVVADLNGDGHLDIATANYGGSGGSAQTVGALLGNGDGTFNARIDSLISGTSAETIAAADVTGDGIIDLAVAGSVYPVKHVYILRGVGNGTFVFQDDFSFTNPNGYAFGTRLALAEFNGDGLIDVAVVNDAWDYGEIDVYFNLGGGIFGNPYSATVPMIPASIEVADMDGDGKIDILVTGSDRANGFSIYTNVGSGTFTPSFFRTSATSGHALPIDLDLDGDNDVVLGTQSGLVPRFNPGNAAFEYDSSVHEERIIKPIDLNGDGKLDLVRTFGGIGVQLNQGNNTFSAEVSYSTSDVVEIVDVNGDAKPDFIMPNTSSASVSVRLNNGNGTFANATNYATGSSPIHVAAADMTGDGKADLAVVNSASNSLSILRNNGNGTFAAKVDYPTAASPRKVVAADMNGDNMIDLVVGADGNRDLDIAYNQGNATFALVDFATSSYSSTDYVVKDFTGDGKADFAVVDGAYPNFLIAVKLNQGGGVFSAPVNYPIANLGSLPLLSIEARDIEGDGRPEICAYWASLASFGMMSGTMSVLPNRGNGIFGTQHDYMTWIRATADFNNDGLMDVIRADSTNATVKYGTCLP